MSYKIPSTWRNKNGRKSENNDHQETPDSVPVQHLGVALWVIEVAGRRVTVPRNWSIFQRLTLIYLRQNKFVCQTFTLLTAPHKSEQRHSRSNFSIPSQPSHPPDATNYSLIHSSLSFTTTTSPSSTTQPVQTGTCFDQRPDFTRSHPDYTSSSSVSSSGRMYSPLESLVVVEHLLAGEVGRHILRTQ